MIERIAKAISDAIDPTSGDPIGVTFHHSEFVEGETMQEQLEQVKSICLAAARAAIEAMREPPEAYMAKDPPFWVESFGWYPPNHVRAAIWRGIIDFALSQSPNSLPSEDR